MPFFRSTTSFSPIMREFPADGFFSEVLLDEVYPLIRDFPSGTELALAVVRSDQSSYFGLRREGFTWRRVQNADSAFEIGSITKVMTGGLLSAFVEEGFLDAYERFPWALRQSPPISWMHLANHSSGMPRLPRNLFWEAMLNFDNPYAKYGEDRLRQYLSRKLRLRSVPGRRYHYSNLGMGLLALGLAELKGQSFERLLQAYIFRPLGMHDSASERARLNVPLVGGLDAQGKPTPNWDLGAFAGAGAVCATAHDLVLFIQGQFGGAMPSLALARVPSFSLSTGSHVGMGWNIRRETDSTWHWHNGGTGGYTSFMSLDEQRMHGVVALSNISALQRKSSAVDELGSMLMRQAQKLI